MTMTAITHHLTDEILAGYAAGTLPEAFNIIVATHISMCDQCRAALAAHEAVGGAVLETAGTQPLDDMALDACFALIDQAELVPKAQPKPIQFDGTLPAPLADYAGGGLGDVKWKPAGMGVKQAILKTSRSAQARLLYIPPGRDIPDHGHNGTEITLVLQGAFKDELDHFGPGDVEICDAQVEHTPVAGDEMPCICLAVTDAPLRFKGLLPRIAQPFLRI